MTGAAGNVEAEGTPPAGSEAAAGAAAGSETAAGAVAGSAAILVLSPSGTTEQFGTECTLPLAMSRH